MGQKVNPIGLRLGINKTWMSKWYVDPREYADTLHEDLKLRKALLAAPEVSGAEISEVEIIRKPQRITLVVGTASSEQRAPTSRSSVRRSRSLQRRRSRSRSRRSRRQSAMHSS